MSLDEAVVPSAVRSARAAVAGSPHLDFADLEARIGAGARMVPLPAAPRDVTALTGKVLRVALATEPRWLDNPPRCETRYGEVPVPAETRYALLASLAEQVRRSRERERPRNRIRVTLALEEHLQAVEASWRAERTRLWRTLRETEYIAADLLGMYLAHNHAVACVERDRYLYPGTVNPRAASPDFSGLCRHIDELGALRKHVRLDELRRDQAIADATTLATACLAGALLVSPVAATARPLRLDRAVWDAVAQRAKLADEARLETTKATTKYLQGLQERAQHHPVLLLLDHGDLAGRNTPNEVARAVDEELTAAEAAMRDLRRAGVNTDTFPPTRSPRDVSPSGLAGRLAGADRLSVWKLPFFVGQALLELPPARALEVKAIMALAAEQAEGDELGAAIAVLGVEAAAGVAAAGGPIGVVLALAWSLIQLGASIRDYSQLQTLFHASLDPAVLLRGVDHGDASKLGIMLDLIGVLAP